MPRIVDHDARRRDLLDAAFPLFADQGYAALSMRGLATALGVSTGVLYHYFDGKDAIFEATVRRALERQVARSRDAAPTGGLPALVAFVSSELDELTMMLQIALDHRRQGADGGTLIAELLAEYRRALAEQYGLSAQWTSVALTVALGALTWRLLDPDGFEAAPLLAALGAAAPQP